MTYTLVAENVATLTVRPGESLAAELPVRDATGREWMLSWSRGERSPLYQFERLALPPRLRKADAPLDTGDAVDGVTLTPVPGRGLPRVPDLLPSLR
jgi:hypothetical protein